MPDLNETRGAVGEPGNACILEATNDGPDAKRAVVRVTVANLCHSHAAYATLLVDAEPRSSRIDLNDTRMRLETPVLPGEHVVLVVQLVDRRNGTLCIRLGETEFELALTSVD